MTWWSLFIQTLYSCYTTSWDSTPGDYPIAFAKHPEEFGYCVDSLCAQVLLEETAGAWTDYRLTASGWGHVRELRRTQRDSNQAFVAMWFHRELDHVYENGFKAALDDTGYQSIRIDLIEHNEKICDRIVAEIRRSGLLIADVTGNRPGVYFEAGFAMGLGLPVIWTCRDTDIDDVHFDTRQYNHIVWKDAANLKTRLADRIEATLPTRVRRVTG